MTDMTQYNSPFTGQQVDAALAQAHDQGTDQGLDTGGPSAITAAQAREAALHAIALHYAVDIATVSAR